MLNESNERTVQQLFVAFSRMDINEILTFFTIDAVYHKIPLARFQGHEEIAGTLGEFFIEGLAVEFESLNVAERDNKILSERITRVKKDGVELAIPIMGIFEFAADGRISAWRDYFDRGQAGIAQASN